MEQSNFSATSSRRYDFALRIANVLDIDIKLICKDNPVKQGEELPAFSDNLNGLLRRKQMFTMMDMLKNTYTDLERKRALKSIKK